ncbi:MAG: VF530 family DNA-binding protein [Cyclobacteriaceae bacterium]
MNNSSLKVEHIKHRITINPSIKSSLTFLRKTPWARTKVERLYLKSIRKRIR